MILTYSTQSAALTRAESEGIAQNLPYHRNPSTGTTRYLSRPREMADGDWGLDVSGYQLTEEELEAVVESVEWKQSEEEF